MPWLLPFSALFPLLLATLTALTGLRSFARYLLPLAPLPALAAGLWVETGALLSFPHALMEATWRMDDLGRAFLLFTAFGWMIAGACAIPHFHGHPRKGSFVIPFLLAQSGNLLLVTAADVGTFYTGFAMMGFASWGLVIHNGTPEALRAGRVYLALVLAGELMVLPGLVQGVLGAESTLIRDVSSHWAASARPLLPLSLLAVGFALKAGLFPFHVWLPLAHPAAPIPASAVLSGCMIKAGLLGWLRFLPLGDLALPALGLPLAGLAATGMLLALPAGWLQSNPKAMLAYSSLSKMGMMLFLCALVLIEPGLAPAALPAVVALAILHSLHKGALFLGVGILPHAGTVGRVFLPLLLLSFAGAPFLAGAVSKTYLKELLSLPILPGGTWIGHLFTAASILSVPLFLRVALALWPTERKRSAGTAATLLWTLGSAAALGLPAVFLHPRGPDFATPAGHLKSVWTGDPGFWIGLGLLALWGLARFRVPFRLPPGDLLHLLPVPSTRHRLSLAVHLNRIEHRLNRAPGGLAYLTVLLFLIAWMTKRWL